MNFCRSMIGPSQTLLGYFGFGSIFPMVLLAFCCLGCNTSTKDFTKTVAQQHMAWAWQETYPRILERIHPPTFRDTIVVLKDTVDFRNRINQIMITLSKAGGGTLRIAPGFYPVKGSIFLQSNVHLHIGEGATLLFSPNPEDYLPVVKSRWEGTFLMNYSPLIYAADKENIAITGKGIIDGQASKSWTAWLELQKKDQKKLRQMGNDQVLLEQRVFGKGHFLRPSALEFINCSNILLEDFTIQGSPFWTIHPVLSSNITVRGLTILAGTSNDDGIDPESCTDVLIEDCIFKTYDDCVAIKAGRDQDGWGYPPSENIIVRNNTFDTKVGSGFCIGSEMSAGVRNVFVENCSLSVSEKHAFQFKSNPDRGGFIENVFIRNIQAGQVKYGFEFTTDYHGWRGNEYFTQYRDFYFQNIHIGRATKKSITIKGRPEAPIERIYFEDVTVKEAKQPEVLKHTKHLVFHNTKINDSLLIDKK